MKRMLNRMLRYADAIVKRGVDKLIDAIAHSAEPQTKNTETPQPQKRMGNDTDCAPQTTGHTTNCGITLMDEGCDISYNVLDRTPEMQWRDQADKGFVPVSKLVRNTMSFNGSESDEIRILWCSMRFAANAENRRTKGQKNKRYNACVSPLSAENKSNISLHKIHKRPLRGWPRTDVRVAKET
ncbi:hypothetical protein [Prevotellamassilia timonensis]|uniref:hypothetical protein n=1 Tax=Prevotellamassilia timonensis TaxID=1852370 RepID=UPI003FEE90FD